MFESLRLEEASLRWDQIDQNYSETLGWVFENPEIGFMDWLHVGTGIYWIRGKPGSGKSTLMKFLKTSQETEVGLKCSIPERYTISGWYFFHNRGSYLQKSLEGLRYSILHQIVLADERLAQLILPLYLQTVRPRRGDKSRNCWALADLEKGFEIIINQSLFPLRLCLFLDALDEYEGRPELVVDFLKSLVKTPLRSMTVVKICFSSRPWTAFLENFTTCPGFSIQDHTKRDVWSYVRGRLLESNSMRQLSTTENQLEREEFSNLISAIAQRAQGVFLWVRLVVDDLLEVRADGAGLIELTEMLSNMPVELEDYYKAILDRVSQRYRLESYIILQVLVCSHEPLEFSAFAYAVDCALCSTVSECLRKMDRGPFSKLNPEEAARRLQSRCGGLVELLEVSKPIRDWHTLRVQFMHQTVEDFVRKPGLEQRVLGQHFEPLVQNGHSFLAKLYLAILHLKKDMTPPVRVDNAFYMAMRHTRLSESSTGISQQRFLDSCEDNAFRPGDECVNSILSFAVASDLRLYIAEKANFVSRNEELLLHVVVKNNGRKLGPMCRLLLSLGADILAEVSGRSPFQLLFQELSNETLNGQFKSLNSEHIDIASAFLVAGQNPDVEISVSFFLAGSWCKPLHLAHSKLTSLLLDHGADVNALTSSGWTALDISALSNSGRCSSIGDGDWKARRDGNFEAARLLINHGGCITNKRVLQWESFVNYLEGYYVLPENFRHPPQLARTT